MPESGLGAGVGAYVILNFAWPVKTSSMARARPRVFQGLCPPLRNTIQRSSALTGGVPRLGALGSLVCSRTGPIGGACGANCAQLCPKTCSSGSQGGGYIQSILGL